MLKNIHNKTALQLFLGFVIGLCFGFLLQKGGVTRYEIIMGQLLLYDWTVFKIIFTAIAVGMTGVYIMQAMGLAQLHRKQGSVGRTVVGGLIFGLGFGVLGYCPGTMLGAVGQGSMDALFGGVIGMLLGVAVYAAIYPRLKGKILSYGQFGKITFGELFHVRHNYMIVVPAVLIVVCVLWLVESFGF
ncbi:MAG: YeeE/YedE thiosulfate transporter family protein [Candidatus Sumerlaeia bacterium]